VLTHSQVVDLEFEVHDGKYHDVDSDEASFKVAGARAFMDAFHKAHPVLLEPVMEMRISIPTDSAGAIFSDLTSHRRAHVLDQWTEVIPAPTEQTGVAFHYDDPSAEAPQAILLAVPPVHAEQWDLASLVATLHETLDLAKVRAVDSELLGPLAQLLPAIFLAESTSSVTVQTKFADSVRGERTIAFRPEE
jgi:translation elongation factor EF-G